MLEAHRVWPLLALPTPNILRISSPLLPGPHQLSVSSLSPAYFSFQILNSRGNEQGLAQFQHSNYLSNQAKRSKNKATSFVQNLENTSGSGSAWKRIGRMLTGTQREKAEGPPCWGPKESAQFN